MSKAIRETVTVVAGFGFTWAYVFACEPIINGVSSFFGGAIGPEWSPDPFLAFIQWITGSVLGMGAGVVLGGGLVCAGFGTALILARRVLGWRNVAN